jgi:phenylacetate-CoA ligase
VTDADAIETEVPDVPDDPLAPLPWAEEQRLLGVGVRVLRRADVRARHLPYLAEAAAWLARGTTEPLADEVAARLARLRMRLWRAPAWCTRLRAAGGSPADLQSLADLAAFPVGGRDTLVAGWRDSFDLDGDPELHLATSSGSSGQALLVPRSGRDGVHMWAAIRFFVEHFGVALPPRPRTALVCALPGGLEYSVRTPQLANGALHRVSTLRPGAAHRLARVRPAILSSDPAGLHWLLAQAPRLAPPLAPGLVLSSAMHLAPGLRARVAAGFAAPLVNYYATTEAGPIAWECLREPGRFHVLHPDVFVESIDGELAVTRLRDGPLPLVRYLTGDRGEVVDGDCSCGVRGRSILGFTGRHPCAFVRPDGSEVDAWSLSWLFKDLPLQRFELAQVAAPAHERFVLTLPPGDLPEALPEALLARRLARVLVRLGFARPRVRVERADLPPAAKPRPFVCRVV